MNAKQENNNRDYARGYKDGRNHPQLASSSNDLMSLVTLGSVKESESYNKGFDAGLNDRARFGGSDSSTGDLPKKDRGGNKRHPHQTRKKKDPGHQYPSSSWPNIGLPGLILYQIIGFPIFYKIGSLLYAFDPEGPIEVIIHSVLMLIVAGFAISALLGGIFWELIV